MFRMFRISDSFIPWTNSYFSCGGLSLNKPYTELNSEHLENIEQSLHVHLYIEHSNPDTPSQSVGFTLNNIVSVARSDFF